MATRKLSISMDDGSLGLARAAAGQAGSPFATWLAQAARDRALREGFQQLAQWRAGADVEADAQVDETERVLASELATRRASG